MHGDGTARQRASGQEGAGLDAVAHRRVLARMQRRKRHALDLDDVRARARDARPHGHEHVRKIHDLGFARGVLYDRGALGRHGGHEQVLGCSHTGEVEYDVRAVQPVGRAGLKEAVVDGELHADGLEADKMHVDLASADLTAARHGHAGASEAANERAEHRDARTHLRHQLVGGLVLVDGGGVHRQRMAVALHPRAQTAQHVGHDADIRDERDVMDGRFPLAQQRGGDQLERRVLRARHGDVAGQRVVALYDDDLFSHGSILRARDDEGPGVGFIGWRTPSEAPFAVPTIIRTGRLRAHHHHNESRRADSCWYRNEKRRLAQQDSEKPPRADPRLVSRLSVLRYAKASEKGLRIGARGLRSVERFRRPSGRRNAAIHQARSA